MRPYLLLPVAWILVSCTPTVPAVTPHLLNVYVTSASSPRVSEIYSCAPSGIVIAQSDPASADLTVRLGEPTPLLTPAFEIGTEDILIINNPQAGVGPLTLEQAQQLFSGQATNWKDVGGNDLPVQVWTFSTGEDLGQIFSGLVMKGRPVTSRARLAVSAQAMSDGVGNMPGSIGYLPRRWKAGNTREALNAATVPVLALPKGQPEGQEKELIACLQADK